MLMKRQVIFDLSITVRAYSVPEEGSREGAKHALHQSCPSDTIVKCLIPKAIPA